MSMTVEEIIRMLDHPATLGEALTEAAKLPFRGDDKVRFEQKRQHYIDGLSDHERPRWVGEMKAFLSLYDGCIVGATDSDKRAETPAKAQSNEFKTDIFISYAHEDEQRVRLIVVELERLGWTVFWDRSIPVGKTWHSYIEHALLAARSVVVVWSEFSIISEWVIEEAEYAKGKKILVPLLIDTVQPPFGFRRIQAANLSGWNNDKSHPEFQKCLDALTSIVTNYDDWIRYCASPIEIPLRQEEVASDFVHISGGLFTMGSPTGEVDRSSDETQHQVKVSDFYLCRYALTVAKFRKFIDESGYQTDAEKANSSSIWDGAKWEDKEGVNWRHGVSGNERALDEYDHPVLHVSWNDVVAYCDWLSRKSGKTLRLPTEAEWEYACRAGTTTPFNTGENLTTDQANYDGNYPYNNNPKGQYRENTVPVESFAPNAWGLYNMHGNVREWCGDWYEGNYYDECKAKGTVENPSGPATGSGRVLRGGYWRSDAGLLSVGSSQLRPPRLPQQLCWLPPGLRPVVSW